MSNATQFIKLRGCIRMNGQTIPSLYINKNHIVSVYEDGDYIILHMNGNLSYRVESVSTRTGRSASLDAIINDIECGKDLFYAPK